MYFAAVVVVYNIFCGNSPTCCALSNMDRSDVQVLIYDNSTRDYGNRKYCFERGWVYLGGHGNMGISKAYNTCIDYLKEKRKDGFVCLFDDDTCIGEEYFNAIASAAADSAAKIYAPLIYSANRLLSPCRLRKNYQVLFFDSSEAAIAYHGTDISAINSGMAIELSVFQNYRYDDNIFLDGVDHNFMQDMHKKGIKIRIIPYCCNHEFSGDSRPPIQSAMTRFQIYANDYRYILRNNQIAYWGLVGKRALSLCLQYKCLSFFIIAFSQKSNSKGYGYEN